MSVYALILAAGASRRFGPEHDKLVVEWRGRPLIEHVLIALEEARAKNLLEGGIVMRSPRGDRVSALAAAHGFDSVEVPTAGLGLSESIKVGFDALDATPPSITAALVCLGDQPRLRLEVIHALIDVASDSPSALVRPRYQDAPAEPGHPIVIGRDHWHLASRGSGDRGLDPILAERGLRWTWIEVTGRNPDVDTPVDLEHLQ